MSKKRKHKKAARRVEQGRLVYYQKSTGETHWIENWQSNIEPDFYQAAENGYLEFFEQLFPRWLPRQGRILEAGCGLAQHVVALCSRGYDCEGVEYGGETVQMVLKMKPDLSIRQGDVTALDVPDKHYAAYISLGVIEHLEEGPEAFLNEAWRILADDGVGLISVPNFHFYRRLRARFGAYRDDKEGLDFYQRAFHPKDMEQILEKCGFEVVHRFGYSTYKGVKDEMRWFKRLARKLRVDKWLGHTLERVPFLPLFSGHMILFVCYKK